MELKARLEAEYEFLLLLSQSRVTLGERYLKIDKRQFSVGAAVRRFVKLLRKLFALFFSILGAVEVRTERSPHEVLSCR